MSGAGTRLSSDRAATGDDGRWQDSPLVTPGETIGQPREQPAILLKKGTRMDPLLRTCARSFRQAGFTPARPNLQSFPSELPLRPDPATTPGRTPSARADSYRGCTAPRSADNR